MAAKKATGSKKDRKKPGRKKKGKSTAKAAVGASPAAGKNPKGAGRKAWKASAKDLKLVREMSALGLPESQIMDALGISHTLFYKQKAGVAEFREALKEGKQRDHEDLLQALHDKAITDKNMTAIIFSLKIKHGYRENAPVMPTDAVPIFVDPDPVLDGGKDDDDER